MAKTMKELREIIESMTAEELEKKLCGEPDCDKPSKDEKKQTTEEKKATKGRGRGRKPKTETMPEPEAQETEVDPYDGMSAKELFNLCKERKIKAEIKKPADYYIDLLKKDDAKKAKEEAAKAEKDDDDWGDDEETTKKSDGGKKVEPENDDDDDDDWDI